MKFSEWEKEVKTLEMDKREELANSIETLLTWEEFSKAFHGPSLMTIEGLLRCA